MNENSTNMNMIALMSHNILEFQIGHAETKSLSHTKVKNVQLYGTVTHISNPSTQDPRIMMDMNLKWTRISWTCHYNPTQIPMNPIEMKLNQVEMLAKTPQERWEIHEIWTLLACKCSRNRWISFNLSQRSMNLRWLSLRISCRSMNLSLRSIPLCLKSTCLSWKSLPLAFKSSRISISLS